MSSLIQVSSSITRANVLMYFIVRENRVDFRTMGNQAAAELLQEVCASMYITYTMQSVNMAIHFNHVCISIDASLSVLYLISIWSFALSSYITACITEAVKRFLKGCSKFKESGYIYM